MVAVSLQAGEAITQKGERLVILLRSYFLKIICSVSACWRERKSSKDSKIVTVAVKPFVSGPGPVCLSSPPGLCSARRCLNGGLGSA